MQLSSQNCGDDHGQQSQKARDELQPRESHSWVMMPTGGLQDSSESSLQMETWQIFGLTFFWRRFYVVLGRHDDQSQFDRVVHGLSIALEENLSNFK